MKDEDFSVGKEQTLRNLNNISKGTSDAKIVDVQNGEINARIVSMLLEVSNISWKLST